MTCSEFIENFNRLNHDNSWWVHFEGRNVQETLLQIQWLDQKAISEDWRHQLTISVELEKPERFKIELLIEKVKKKKYILHYLAFPSLLFCSVG